jgi:hypothetical protein
MKDMLRDGQIDEDTLVYCDDTEGAARGWVSAGETEIGRAREISKASLTPLPQQRIEDDKKATMPAPKFTPYGDSHKEQGGKQPRGWPPKAAVIGVFLLAIVIIISATGGFFFVRARKAEETRRRAEQEKIIAEQLQREEESKAELQAQAERLAAERLQQKEKRDEELRKLQAAVENNKQGANNNATGHTYAFSDGSSYTLSDEQQKFIDELVRECIIALSRAMEIKPGMDIKTVRRMLGNPIKKYNLKGLMFFETFLQDKMVTSVEIVDDTVLYASTAIPAASLIEKDKGFSHICSALQELMGSEGIPYSSKMKYWVRNDAQTSGFQIVGVDKGKLANDMVVIFSSTMDYYELWRKN